MGGTRLFELGGSEGQGEGPRGTITAGIRTRHRSAQVLAW